MNRRATRAARNGDVTVVDTGHLSERDQNYKRAVSCYVCGALHMAFGLARITNNSGSWVVPVCGPCLISDDLDTAIIRKFWNAPDLKITDGGETTTAQVLALMEKRDETEH